MYYPRLIVNGAKPYSLKTPPKKAFDYKSDGFLRCYP